MSSTHRELTPMTVHEKECTGCLIPLIIRYQCLRKLCYSHLSLIWLKSNKWRYSVMTNCNLVQIYPYCRWLLLQMGTIICAGHKGSCGFLWTPCFLNFQLFLPKCVRITDSEQNRSLGLLCSMKLGSHDAKTMKDWKTNKCCVLL